MKPYMRAALAGIAGFAIVGIALPEMSRSNADGVDPMVSGSIQRAGAVREYTLSNITDKTACLVERGQVVTSRSRDFKAAADCDTVWPGLASARNWTENEDGSVILSDASGNEILTVSEDSAKSYVATDPSDASITLLQIR